MRRCFWKQILLITTLLTSVQGGYSVPAPRGLVSLTQPDGKKLSAYLKGDEFFHYAVSPDGYILLSDSDGYYTYAVHDSAGNLKSGLVKAANETARSTEEQTFLKTIKPGMSFSGKQQQQSTAKRIERAIQRETRLRSATTSADGLINEYPTTGTVRSLVILVNFSDVSFTTANPQTEFENMLNKHGYNKRTHIGSVRDYYLSNSDSLFTPEFDVVGPVTLSNPMAYYGANDSEGNDVHPAKMVKEACQLVSSSVDFSKYDADKDGYVDNVYIFYAGKGEADGGSANTIWPHSWSLSGEGLSLALNGKSIEDYACSAELDGSNVLTGIGTFTHEFGHILGLPDMYDVDYDNYNGEGFDIGEWSLMAYGAYNSDGCVPPCLTLLERKMLGWATPVELSVPADLVLRPLVSSNSGYIINTSNAGEYFLLENRQQKTGTWDAYVPYHGMLIYHIDMRSNASTSLSYYGTKETWSYATLWKENMVNAIAQHQCADIEEADNSGIIYTGKNYSSYYSSLKGDPFPGASQITLFTDNTTPSMKTWNGTALSKPVSSITETDSLITFKFMGGSKPMKAPVTQPAKSIQPFLFTASWSSVEGATAYYLDVYTLDVSSGDSVKTYICQHAMVTDTFKIISVKADLTDYYYQVRATDGFNISGYSGICRLTTTNSTPTAKAATEVKPFSFRANWKPESWATGYYLTIYEQPDSLSSPTILSGYDQLYVTDTFCVVNELDDKRTYTYRVKATDGQATGNSSALISLTTAKATAVIDYVKGRTIYLKGIDPKTPVRLYNLAGQLIQVSTENIVEVARGGLYIAEVWFDGSRKHIKVLVE